MAQGKIIFKRVLRRQRPESLRNIFCHGPSCGFSLSHVEALAYTDYMCIQRNYKDRGWNYFSEPKIDTVISPNHPSEIHIKPLAWPTPFRRRQQLKQPSGTDPLPINRRGIHLSENGYKSL